MNGDGECLNRPDKSQPKRGPSLFGGAGLVVVEFRAFRPLYSQTSTWWPGPLEQSLDA